MSKPTPPPQVEDSDEFTRFDRMTRALFKVDRRDVPKHEPKKRPKRESPVTSEPT
jgi:hypothetical protein